MAALAQDNDSDYGYDLTAEDEDLIYTLAEDIAPRSQPAAFALAALCNTDDVLTNLEPEVEHNQVVFDLASRDDETGNALGLWPRPTGSDETRELSSAHVAGDSGLSLPVARARSRSTPVSAASDSVQYPDLSRAVSEAQDSSVHEVSENDKSGKRARRELQSPIHRFRTFPKKPFSVSDLTAGAWCEQQYEYVLTRLPGGKRTRTEAMKGGSVAHQKLEEEIYTPVTVSVEKKEDGFGLRLWNIVQGLRTLRDTRMTRELEVWGFVDGNIVNGIIDGVSYDNPEPGFEEEVRSSQGSQSSPQQTSQDPKITDFFPSSPGAAAPQHDRQVYIWDVKTRSWNSFPDAAQERTTKIQLFLYHRFLSDIAAEKLDYMSVFQRYGLNADEPFSDVFMAQIGSLHDEIFDRETSASGGEDPGSGSCSQPRKTLDATPDLIKYRSLGALLPLLQAEIRLTFPHGAASLGQIVSVEYRLRSRRGDGEDGNSRLIGTRTFYVEHATLELYLSRYMEWWRGQRKPDGVAVEEAYKCRSCEFVADCEWRMRQNQEMLRKAMDGNKTTAR